MTKLTMMAGVTPNLEAPLLDAVVRVATAFQDKEFPAAVAELRDATVKLRAAEAGDAEAKAGMTEREAEIAADRLAADAATEEAGRIRAQAEQALIDAEAAARASRDETDRLAVQAAERIDRETDRLTAWETRLKAMPGDVEATDAALKSARQLEARAQALKDRYAARLAELGLAEAGT